MIKSAATHFNNVVEKYDDVSKSNDWSAPKFILGQIKGRIQCAPEHILDLGIGTGLVAELLRKQYPTSYITGLDISERMMAVCKDKNVADSLLVADITNDIDISDNSIDIVTCCGVADFLPSLEKTISEAIRITKPEGVILITYEPPNLLHTGKNTITHKDCDISRSFERAQHIEIIPFESYRLSRNSIKNHLAYVVV